MKIDKNTRDRFKDQPYYGACEGTNIYFIFIKLGKSKNTDYICGIFGDRNYCRPLKFKSALFEDLYYTVGLGASKAYRELK